MSRLFNLIAAGTLCLSLAGCGFMQPPPQINAGGYYKQHNGSDFKTGWTTSESEKGLTVETAMRNVGHALVTDLWLEISLVREDKVVAKKGAILLGKVGPEESGNFVIFLKGAFISEGDQLHFRYTYNGTDNDTTSQRVTELKVDAVTGEILD